MPSEQTDCACCEQRLLEAGEVEAAASAEGVREHLSACARCAEFYDSLREVKPYLDRCRVPEPAEALIAAVLADARRLLPSAALREPERASLPAGLFRVVLASLTALPLVVLINAALGYALFEFAAMVLPRTLALYCVGLFAAWVSLGVSLSYASLPFLSLLAGGAPAPARRR